MDPARRLFAGSLALPASLAALATFACHGGGLLESEWTPVPPRGEDAPAAEASHRPSPVALRGSLVSTEQVPDPNPPAGCELFLNTILEGRLTHLGAFTGEGTTCGFNGVFGVLDPPFNPGGGPPPYFVSDFTVEQTYTGSHGDELRISGEGVLVRSLTDGSSGFIGDGVVVGGTGRFEGATGEFDVMGVRGEVSYDGWILFDASRGRHDRPGP